MERLGAEDLRRALEQLQHVYAVTDLAAFPAVAMAAVKEQVGCDWATYTEFQPEKPRIIALTDPPEVFTPELLPAFEQYLPQHPVFEHYNTTADPTARKISDFVSRANYHRLGIYQEFYKRTLTPVEDQMGFWLSFPKPHMLTMAFSRSRRSFTERDRAVMNLMRPHLVQAYRNAEAMMQLASERDTMAEASGGGVIATGRDGGIHSVSPMAEIWLDRYLPTWRRRPSQLPDLLRRWIDRQQINVSSATELPAAREALIIERDAGQLIVRVITGEAPGRLLLLLREHAHGIEFRPLTRPGAGLSPRLQRVLECLLSGDSEKQVAIRLGLSRHTVHQYVKMLYKELGVGSRAELMVRYLRPGG